MLNTAMGIDLDACTGCFACQNACKMVNDLAEDVKWLRVMPEYCQPEEVNGRLYMDRFPIPVTLEACENCSDRESGNRPLCATVCMGRALIVDSEDNVQKWALGRRSVVFSG